MKQNQPIPSEWFSGQTLTFLIDGGLRSFHALTLFEQLKQQFDVSLRIRLTRQTVPYLPLPLLRRFSADIAVAKEKGLIPSDGIGDCLGILLFHPADTLPTEFARIERAFDGPVIRCLDGENAESGHESTVLYTSSWIPFIEQLASFCSRDRSWEGRRILVTAGPTEESLDPVRILTNRSSGKMGFALARQASLRGAEVILITGPVSLDTPAGVRRVDVVSAGEMLEAAEDHFASVDVVFAAAAVEDLRPVRMSDEKIKKGENISIECENTPDILATLSQKSAGQYLMGFSVETENVIENSREKLHRKQLDAIVVNNPLEPGAGFRHDTNRVTVITADNGVNQLEKMSKDELAVKLLEISGREMSRHE